MFVVCFGDGLGNQMFQYAFYRSLQIIYPENNVSMDIFNVYGDYIHNGFELESIFGIKPKVCNKRVAYSLSEYFPKYKKRYAVLNLLVLARQLLLGYKDSFIKQDDPTGYYPQIYQLNLTKSYMLCGNWVNEKYFSNIKNLLLKEFEFPIINDESNLNYQSMIDGCNSVSVHVRRGDYLNSSMISLDLDYYKRAQCIIEKKVKNPIYFVFTDDKEYIHENFKFLRNYNIVEGNTGNYSYRDMQLMSMCKHNIIANSTFSFWGAYLNQNPNKLVVAPMKAHPNHYNAYACNDWITIEN